MGAQADDIVECVVNVSEGTDRPVLERLTSAAGAALRDVHRDPDHNRSVFTLAGARDLVADSARALADATVAALDLRTHHGAHPRLGVLDVVPFVPYRLGGPASDDLSGAVAVRDAFAAWLAATHGIPAFLYGPQADGTVRTLPELRRHAFRTLAPDTGPAQAHPTAGATAVGARPVLVAYNVWVTPLEVAKAVAPLVRGPAVRALGLRVGQRAQVSCNLVDPWTLGPAALFDDVARLVRAADGTVEGGELVGLLPESVLLEIPRQRWPELGLSAEATVEARVR